ncbi:MAG: restriction endonuclease subunit S, partial [bacterium]
MDTKKLKQKILDLAIRGKLVPQDPSDEPASVLLERIRTEKEQLIKDKKIKRDKNESYIYRSGKSYYEKRGDKTVCIDDEIPFEIPESWEWCRVRDISQSYIGLTYKPTDVSNNGTIVLRSSNIANGKLVFNDLVRVTCDISEKLQVENNDIIICARNGSRRLVGKSAIIYGISEKMTFGAFMAICKSKLYKYVYHYLQSQLFFDQLFFVSGTTTIYQLTQARFNDFLIPIPPINEQIAIVSKLEQLNGYIDRLNLDAGDLKNIIKQIKTQILDLAIRGKLVPQDPTDEPASVLL